MPTPPKSPDDMPLAAYGGSGVDDGADVPPEPTPDTTPTAPTAATVAAATPLTPSTSGAPETPPTAADLPIPEDERVPGPSSVALLINRLRTSRVAAGAVFAVVIIVGLVLLTGGRGSPGATAATPTSHPTSAPTILPPSGDVSMTLAGAATGTFTLQGLAGGQQVGGGAVTLAWGDAQQTSLQIVGPLDRGTRVTDETLVLTLGVVVKGVPVTFTSKAGECTIGMAEVVTKVQGSFTCHRLKGPDGKVALEVSGTYHS